MQRERRTSTHSALGGGASAECASTDRLRVRAGTCRGRKVSVRALSAAGGRGKEGTDLERVVQRALVERWRTVDRRAGGQGRRGGLLRWAEWKGSAGGRSCCRLRRTHLEGFDQIAFLLRSDEPLAQNCRGLSSINDKRRHRDQPRATPSPTEGTSHLEGVGEVALWEVVRDDGGAAGKRVQRSLRHKQQVSG
jgi:hypothetical protein